MKLRILQLTDLHLQADPDALLKGVPTYQSLCDVLDDIRLRDVDFDYLIITGDLAHDEQIETYRLLRELLSEWIDRCRLLPGNHDSREYIREVFGEIVSGGEGPLQFSLAAGNWRLIGLDSHVPGEVSGRISQQQLKWLENELESHANQPTLIFMHHPPFAVNSPWLDRIGLEESDGLVRLINSAPQVKLLSTGHVHQEYRGRLRAATVFTSPSTSVQFQAREREPVYEAIPPGYRWFILDSNDWESEVVRLPKLKYPPSE